ncbi:hypothetical protein JKG47_21665, partial [Acidithiobacillus sp. MC6.1]|nr:hypothetical protein [Acidithiobacillus sp. MC6.1]
YWKDAEGRPTPYGIGIPAGYNTEIVHDGEVSTEGLWLFAMAVLTIFTPMLSAYMYGSWILYPLGATTLAVVIVPRWRQRVMRFGVLKTLFAVFALLMVVGAMVHGAPPVHGK